MTAAAAVSPDASVLLRALEQATLRACAVSGEVTVDGWLLRLSPGKAKRSRSAQALAAGSLPLDDRLRDLVARFRGAGLPPLIRLTPFSQPEGLDTALAERGWVAFDESLVMSLRLGSQAASDAGAAAAAAAAASTPPGDVAPASTIPVAAAAAAAAPIRPVDVDGATHAAWVGAQRGSSAAEIAAHVARLADSPVPYGAVHLVDRHGTTVAGGQLAIDGDGFAGLYDVFVDAAHRRAGHARTLCALLVARAAARGAAVAYLQVDAGNGPALALYRSLGFGEAYRYHYRQAPAGPGASSRP